MANDKEIRRHIGELVSEERELRRKLADGEISADEEHARLRRIEMQLDQYWDLLRQREARREYGEDPDGAEVRQDHVVENYEG